jgi:hypothetical protein
MQWLELRCARKDKKRTCVKYSLMSPPCHPDLRSAHAPAVYTHDYGPAGICLLCSACVTSHQKQHTVPPPGKQHPSIQDPQNIQEEGFFYLQVCGQTLHRLSPPGSFFSVITQTPRYQICPSVVVQRIFVVLRGFQRSGMRFDVCQGQVDHSSNRVRRLPH